MVHKNSYRPRFLTLEDRSSPTSLLDSPIASLLDDVPSPTRHVRLSEHSPPIQRDPGAAAAIAPPRFLAPIRSTAPVFAPAVSKQPAQLPARIDPNVIQETIKAPGPGLGAWIVTSAHTETRTTPFGYFNFIGARSNNPIARPRPEDQHLTNGSPAITPYIRPTGALASYATRRTAVTGVRYNPFAQSSATVTAATPPVYTWTGVGSSWGVTVTGPTGIVPGETALANIRIRDPVSFGPLSPSDGPFTVQFDPTGSWSIDFPPQDPENGIVYDATVTISGSAQSGTEGYENLFDYTLIITPGNVQAVIHSNPNLGWDNGYMAAQIVASYSWDGEFMTYNGGPLVASGIPVPQSCNPIGGECAPSTDFAMGQDVTAVVTTPLT